MDTAAKAMSMTRPRDDEMSPPHDLCWFQRHRLEWISETLRIFGFINREHIQRKFDLSTPQASNDLSIFQRLHPDAMTYDKSAHRYVANKVLDDARKAV